MKKLPIGISTLEEVRAKDYVFIDTAGVRRRARVDGVLEKFSIVKTLSSIADLGY